jgi:hypothetical protein
MAFHSRRWWCLAALVPSTIFGKLLRARQGSRRPQDGPPAFNTVGADAARATFSSAFHRPSGILGVVRKEADLRGRGGTTEEIDVFKSKYPMDSRERHISSQLLVRSVRLRTSTKVLSRPVIDIAIPDRSVFITLKDVALGLNLTIITQKLNFLAYYECIRLVLINHKLQN